MSAVALAPLKTLLSDLFTADELRHFLAEETWADPLLDDLPGEDASKSKLTHQVAAAIGRHGLDTDELWDALRRARPKRVAEIDAVAGGSSPLPSGPETVAQVAAPPRAPSAAPARPGTAPQPRMKSAPATAPAEPPWRPARLLHLSDLHFSAARAWDQDPVLSALVLDVARLRAAVGEIHRVVVTGDIANWGKKEEYNRAAEWLRGPLARAAGVDGRAIRVVAGNHDVDRSAINRAAWNLDKDIVSNGDEAIAEIMKDDEQRALLLRRLSAFLDFARLFHPDLIQPWWKSDEDVAGWSLRFLGLNTAWLSGSHKDARGEVDDHRRLVIGAWQWDALFPADAPEVDLTVALMHHPWEMLAEADRRARQEATLARCGVVLRGHLHDAEAVSSARPGGRRVLELAAGACYADPREGWPHGYQLLELDPGRSEARIHLRKWHARERRWIADRERYPDATPDGVATLDLRRSPRPPQPPPAPTPAPPPAEPAPELADYKRQIRDRADVLAQVFRAPGGPSALSQVYVAVRLSAEASHLAPEEREDGPFGPARPWLKRWFADGRKAPCPPQVPTGPFKLEDEVTDVPGARWAVLGDPGGGKTTLLRHTALLLLDQGAHLPVPLKVSELKDGLASSVQCVYGPAAAAHVQDALRQKRAVVLLDGLDEVTDRAAALAAVRRAAAEAGACPLVLASRPIGWQRPSADFVELALCPLGREEQRRLLEAWVPDPGRVARALRRLDRTARLRRLGENPLLLTLVALLLREGEDIPERRGELYTRAVSILLTRASDPERAQRRLREPDLARQALAYAALRLHGRSEEVYRTTDLVEALMEHERHRVNVREIWGGPGAFLAEVAETTGLLVPTTSSAEGAPAFAFPHRTFREHLAAVALERDIAVHGVGDVPAEVLRDAARKSRVLSVPPAAGALGRVLSEARERPERWSEVLALTAPLLGEGGADALVRRVAAEGSPVLVQRVVAESEGLSSDTVLGVLGCERGWDKWEQRKAVIKEVPALVSDLGVAVRLLNRLRRETRDGNDLYWIRETLLGVVACEDADPEVAREAGEVALRIFDHIPPVNLTKVRALMKPWWRRIPAKGQPLGPYRVGGKECNDETPVHEVRLTAPLWMLGVPVTWEMYRLFDPDHDAARVNFTQVQKDILFSGGEPWPEVDQDRHPVYYVTWYAASMFSAWVGGRLPLEPEWEIACRAGNNGRYWSGDQESNLARVGWYAKNSQGHTHPVGELPANAWGLHDMHGNVWEWCLDGYDEKAYQGRQGGLAVDPTKAAYTTTDGKLVSADSAARGVLRVVRGGSWYLTPEFARSAYRGNGPPSGSWSFAGFRPILPVVPSER